MRLAHTAAPRTGNQRDRKKARTVISPPLLKTTDSSDGMFAKLNGLACFSAPFLPGPRAARRAAETRPVPR